MHVGRICYEQGIKDEKERQDMDVPEQRGEVKP